MNPDWAAIVALARRDLRRLYLDRGRWAGITLQPLIMWFVLGFGMGGAFTAPDGTPGYARWFYPGAVALVTLFSTVFAGMSIVEERESGLLRLTATAPVRPWAVVAGKIAGGTLMALLQTVPALVLAPWAGYPLTVGAVVGAVGASALCAAAFSAWTSALGVRVSSSHAFHALMSVVFVPAWAVSGAMFAPPAAVAGLAALNPVAWTVELLRAVLTGRPSPWSPAGPVTAAALTAAFGLVGAWVAVRGLRPR